MNALWNGRLGLAEAFWTYAILYGTLVNLIATIAGLAVLTLELPGALAVALFLAPLPYVLVAVVGVWRSAAHYEGPPERAMWARVAVIVWAALMVVM
jgi:hypothetical protein